VTTTSGRTELDIGPGGWCWFQSPRAELDGSGALWLGVTQGTHASSPGSVDVIQVDLDPLRTVRRTQLAIDRVDDHTSPSIFPTASGVQVGWAAHRPVDWLELGQLGERLQRIRRPDALVAPGRGMSYVSAHRVGDEHWVLYRGERFSWNLLTSSDSGHHWSARGLAIAPDVVGQRPYIVAAAEQDRLHIVVSDGNPTEYPGTSVSYGTIHADRTITDNAGRGIGTVGHAPPSPRRLTRLIRGTPGTTEHGDTDGWMCDLRVIHHRPTALLMVRDPWPATGSRLGKWRHAYRWARQRSGGRWTVEHLAWAGAELYPSQPDYSGLATLDPTDPTRVVVSANVHPATGQPLISAADGRVHWELFWGQRVGEGRWQWKALTHDSRADNLRPIIVADAVHRVVAWMRGSYRAWTDFDTNIVVHLA